jgi:hypothetical protein
MSFFYRSATRATAIVNLELLVQVKLNNKGMFGLPSPLILELPDPIQSLHRLFDRSTSENDIEHSVIKITG